MHPMPPWKLQRNPAKTNQRNCTHKHTPAVMFLSFMTESSKISKKASPAWQKIEAKGSKYRIGINAAHLLASRYYLFMENWEKVEEHTSALVDSYGRKTSYFRYDHHKLSDTIESL